MSLTIETIIEETTGMLPSQFEDYCESKGILVEWLEVTVSDFDDGYYNVILPEYDDVGVFSSHGLPIEFNLMLNI
jgi:hypothetical protein